MDPALYLLNLLPANVHGPNARLLLHVLTAAKCLISLFWKKPDPPYSDLYAPVKYMRLMEHLTAQLKDKMDASEAIWSNASG
ncbi:hypothetical protein GDO81_015685 [Engystomops pustulosus]|uniref:Uncharacterized protein n=1 Tax=Engystomops pustulosus TaxID=76066 RepID=A0AAV7AML8_ENGPU|nr:hypothetical protein GDO81_015685 [Engystomops pustulosus]